MQSTRNFFRQRGNPKTVQGTRSEAVNAGKGLVTSKTFWMNLLVGTVSLLTALGQVDILPASAAVYLTSALALANILLRAITDQPITSVLGGK